MALYAFDGTWNDEKASTNVRDFFDVYQRNAPSRWNRYFPGVGTNTTFAGKIAGGVWGSGESEIVDQAVAALDNATMSDGGDATVDIVGFSRGAATALDFANRVYKLGYRIRFLGLWDTVAAFGLANLGFYFSRLTFGHQLTLPATGIDYCFHAMALDERRPAFVVTRVNRAREVWFRGCHTDIGGGAQSFALSDVALAWMLRKAAAVGLPVKPEDIAALKPDAAAPIGPTLLSKASKWSRTVKASDLVHYTVQPRAGHVNPTAPWPVETTADEACAQPVLADGILGGDPVCSE